MRSQEQSPYRRIALVGLGLMGGSLARGLKALPAPPHLRAVSRDPEDLRAGMEAGVVDEGARGPEELLRNRDLLVFATPLGATLALMEEFRPFLEPDTVVTDLASLKAPVLARAEALGLEARYVGSHPMVGGTGTGFSHATDRLYEGGRIWLVSGPGVAPDPRAGVRCFWEGLGGRPVEIGAREHDESMAWVSHLPQLTSNALALAVKAAGYSWSQMGPGGRGMTRLAGSAPGMWRDLLEEAPAALPEALGAVEGALSELRALLVRGDTDEIARRMNETLAWVEGGS